jgi:hypothetical protein
MQEWNGNPSPSRYEDVTNVTNVTKIAADPFAPANVSLGIFLRLHIFVYFLRSPRWLEF